VGGKKWGVLEGGKGRGAHCGREKKNVSSQKVEGRAVIREGGEADRKEGKKIVCRRGSRESLLKRVETKGERGKFTEKIVLK